MGKIDEKYLRPELTEETALTEMGFAASGEYQSDTKDLNDREYTW